MDTAGFIQGLRAGMAKRGHWPTRQKLLVFGATLVVIGMLMGVFETSPDAEVETFSEVFDLSLPERFAADGTAGAGGDADPRQSAGPSPETETDSWNSVTVQSGQTLDAIFRQHGFSVALLHQILALNEDTKGLKQIRPGDVFDFRTGESGELAAMRYALDERRYLVVHNQGGRLDADVQTRAIATEIAEAQGAIDSSLFVAGKRAGLSDAMVMKLAYIFGWDIDFVLDIREGDRFMLVYEKLYREGEFLRDGEILAATFVNQGQRFQAIRFENEQVSGYFAPDGRDMRKAFLRAPLNFSYISSSFNPRRMHPVLKRVRPHNGIDYHAPRGTPVYAAGAGTVTRSGYSSANGHHVFIKHAGGIETRYLHFTKRTVKKGQKVAQGETIGTVGSTGLATGPHLHYEFVVNGVHRNPRTVAIPEVAPLEGESLAAFQSLAAPLLTQLGRMESASLYASRE